MTEVAFQPRLFEDVSQVRRHIVMFSGGLGSAFAGQRVADKVGYENVGLLFTDTIVEHDDLYRFLIETAAHIFQLKISTSLVEKTRHIPSLRSMPARKHYLQQLRENAMREIPGLIWIADGRTPWEVYRAERFLGNSLIDPCSKLLKRKVADKWLRENRDPDLCIAYLGIDFTEEHRFDDGHGRGAKNRFAKNGWRCEAPLCEAPFRLKDEFIAYFRSVGIEPPRLYGLDFSHNNCGGGCCKAGQGHWLNLLTKLPEVYAYWEDEEQDFIRFIQRDVAMLSETVAGIKKPLTLKEFRLRAQAGGKVDTLEIGGCGCFLDDELLGEAS